ncbi:MAG: hypothetical protein ACOVO1_03115 [Chitinophagaceae bacterium]
MKIIEDTLKIASDSIINSENWMERFENDAHLIKGLVGALKIPYSFNYRFDSVRISKLYAPDSSFRIFTWQVSKDLTFYRQRGAIQMRTTDGSLKLYPLFDVSDFTNAPNDSVRDATRWIGAIYYSIILKTYNNKKYYTLLGRDDNNERTNKKWIDILTFDDAGRPQFGRNCFVYPNDGIKPPQPCYRFCLEFRKNAGVTLRYDEKFDEIIFDHLISENNDVATKSTLIPYGDYEAFRWQNGKWYFNAQPFDVLEIDDKPKTFPKPFLEKTNKKRKKF